MKKRRRLLTVAGLLVTIAVIDFILLYGTDAEPGIVSSWRLFLTCLLAFFLVLGKSAARWVAVVLTGLGAFGAFVTTAIVAVSGVGGPGYGFVVAWMAILTIIYAGISAFLAFSAGVSREIRRIEGRMR